MTPELNREYPELDNSEVFEQMVELTIGQMEPVGGRLRRAQHAKATGCVTAQFRIADTVAAGLRHGVFSEPGRVFSAIVRFSNSQGTFEKDSAGTARGLAIKILGGQRLMRRSGRRRWDSGLPDDRPPRVSLSRSQGVR